LHTFDHIQILPHMMTRFE